MIIKSQRPNQNQSQSQKRLVALRLFIISIILITATGFAQNYMQPYKLVDGHTAGVLPRGHYDFEFNFYPAGDLSYSSGMLAGMHFGVTNRLTLGLSYGGEGIIGRGNRARWNSYQLSDGSSVPLIGVFAKYRLFEERFATPALAIGFDNQGYGGLTRNMPFGYKGYVYKSPGLFAAMSKNYVMLRTIQIGFHGVVNYSLEEASEVTWPNALGGLDIGINEELALAVEYDLAINDISGTSSNSKSRDKYFRPQRGYLNLGLRWAFAPNFHVEAQLKDLFENKVLRASEMGPLYTGNNIPIGWSREIKIVYYSKF